jgi:hypothetical protein
MIIRRSLVRDVEMRPPRAPGKYAFFVDSLDNLPSQFAKEAKTRPLPQLVYLGKADVSLAQRVWQEECLHRPGYVLQVNWRYAGI